MLIILSLNIIIPNLIWNIAHSQQQNLFNRSRNSFELVAVRNVNVWKVEPRIQIFVIGRVKTCN